MITRTLDPRELALEGSVNFRDLGGLMTQDGRRVRTGRVFRSDALHGLTPADLTLLSRYGIGLVVDLRSPEEIDRSGTNPLLAAGSRMLHAPIIDREATAPPPDPSQPMDVLYARMLETGASRFGEIFTALSEESNLPAVIHCAAGKDRTGVTVALLLRLLDVPDGAIVADYAITDRNMSRMMELLRASGAITDRAGDFPAHYMRAIPETMTAFLAALDHTFGSAHDYLASAGVTAQQVVSLRERLLEPVDQV